MRNGKLRWLKPLAGAALLFALAACTTAVPYNMPYEVAKLELNSKQAKPGKAVQGKDCVTVILGLRFAAASVLNAEQEALQAAGSKILVQKTVYGGTEGNILGLIASECWYVEGRGVNL